MNRLNVNNPLFKILALKPPKWWTELIKDKDIVVQIRKDNYIDVYYNGGNIIRRLVFDGRSFKGETHYKYIPLESGGDNYVPYIFENDSIRYGKANIIKLGSFSRQSLQRIKEAIENYYPSGSEKAIQYDFVKNDPYFIDSEFEYSYSSGGKNKIIRIDLVRMDALLKKIVFVEVKTMGDRRLLNDKITRQLSDYQEFVTNHKRALLVYYKKIIEIKKMLKILPSCILKEDINNYGILEKPLLLFGDCEQTWIDENASMINTKIQSQAIGCYYFGNSVYKCDIIEKSKRNRYIFHSICNS